MNPMRPASTTTLAGWGANYRVPCRLVEPATSAEVAGTLDPNGTVARGLGRSYGDCAVNAHGLVIGTARLSRILSFDENTGTLVCEGGTTLESIIAAFAGRGWFPMITPGTKFVTVAGCIANDVHGKAHHAQGSFSNCVESMTILLASGEVLTASRDANPDLFWATFGGMGLLGIILTATLRLRRIETTYFHQRALRVNNLEQMLSALDEQDERFPYSVATLDVFATGANLGRGVLTVGDHAKRADLPLKLAGDPLRLSGRPKLGVPFDLPEFTLNPVTMRIVNAAIQRIQSGSAPIGHYETFFYPLDKIAHWNRGYGRRGFTQYQFVIPFDNALSHLRRILTAIFSSGALPFLNILKRLGPQGEGILSFPRAGYTFAIDFPVRSSTPALIQQLDRLVLDAGGRIYLGKDSYTTATTFASMYPALGQWLRIKAKYDPQNVFTSSLGRRVGLSQGEPVIDGCRKSTN